ncbi:MAG: hypothetical protein ACRC0V_04690, partial [Fusobacteriaceae bacterium]
ILTKFTGQDTINSVSIFLYKTKNYEGEKMKKILLGLIIVSGGIFAEESVELQKNISFEKINYYFKLGGKIGGEIYSGYSEVSDSSVTTIKENIERENKSNSSISLEFQTTYNFTPKIEFGLGTGYYIHPDLKNPQDGGYLIAGYSSIPIYIIGKYTFMENSTFNPYLIGNIGYSFNKYSFTKSPPEQGTTSPYPSEAIYSPKNGLYYGIGAGVQYKSWSLDIMYKIFYSEYEYVGGTTVDFKNLSPMNYSAVGFTIGYKI